MDPVPAVFPLLPTTQSYDWGKRGSKSKVAQFAAASNIPGFKLDEQTPYAELWMGTHPSSPSRIFSSSNETLSEYLAAHPELIGNLVINQFNCSNGNLPFLFKILSIEKALSIQSHPDKPMAENLHANHPEIYRDPNHKPEMALALTPFTGLCGFLPIDQIATHMLETPEFAALIPNTISQHFLSISSSSGASDSYKAALKDVFSALMTADESNVKDELSKLTRRFMKGDLSNSEKDIKDLVLRLDDQFPGDIGVFCSFMLNYVRLNPGEAIFLGAGEPHAYVSGDIVECMANSDNVIRAGLTPKLRDIPNLISGLTYVASPPFKHIVQPVSFEMSSTSTLLYNPPAPEFSVLLVKVNSGEVEVHSGIAGPSIAIVTDGEGAVSWGSDQGLLQVSMGSVFFIAAGTKIKVMASDEPQNALVLFRAFVHVKQ